MLFQHGSDDFQGEAQPDLEAGACPDDDVETLFWFGPAVYDLADDPMGGLLTPRPAPWIVEALLRGPVPRGTRRPD